MRALLLIALLAIPLVTADHVYSHRLVIDGRLLGNDGLPLPGRVVTVASTGQDLLEPCREGSRVITDESGDFRFCYHIHELAPSTRYNLSYGNTSVERPVDVAMRRSFLVLVEPNETGTAPENWSQTFRVSGRAWRPGPTTLEGVRVFGEAMTSLPVNLTVHDGEGNTNTFRSQTDGYGDYDLIVQEPANATQLTVTVEAMGRSQPVPLDATAHRAFAPIYVPYAGDAVHEPTKIGTGPTEQRPGSASPRADPVIVIAVAIGLVIAIAVSRRKKG